MSGFTPLTSRLVPITSLSAAYQKAAAVALQSYKNSYSPYSNFYVGAGLLHPDGHVTAGTNYENAIYQGTCAERSAIVSANTSGRRQATAIAVYGRPGDANAVLPADTLCTPCGLCRQFLVEVSQLSGTDMEVILVTFDQKQCAVVKLSELLPAQFGPCDLRLDLSKWSKGCCDAHTAEMKGEADKDAAVAAPTQS